MNSDQVMYGSGTMEEIIAVTWLPGGLHVSWLVVRRPTLWFGKHGGNSVISLSGGPADA